MICIRRCQVFKKASPESPQFTLFILIEETVHFFTFIYDTQTQTTANIFLSSKGDFFSMNVCIKVSVYKLRGDSFAIFLRYHEIPQLILHNSNSWISDSYWEVLNQPDFKVAAELRANNFESPKKFLSVIRNYYKLWY